MRSMDTIHEFLSVVAGKSQMSKTIHNFIYHVIKVQRAWKRHSTIVAAQLGIFALQFDTTVKSRKSPDQFLTPAEHKFWTSKISTIMLQKADTQTRRGQRNARRATAAANSKPATPADDEAAPAAEDPMAGGTLSATAQDRFGVIDMDCKLAALSRYLRKRKVAYRKVMRTYELEVKRVEKMVAQQREIEAARAVVTGGEEGSAKPSDVAAAAGATDLAAQMGDFASMLKVKEPPKPKILLAQDEIVALIAEALLATADKIGAGEAVDQHKSLGGGLRNR